MLFFFFNDTATTEIYTLSLHDALPILTWGAWPFHRAAALNARHRATTMDTLISGGVLAAFGWSDRKSTRLNSSHANISYAVFCLKKKKPLPLSRPAHPLRRLVVRAAPV